MHAEASYALPVAGGGRVTPRVGLSQYAPDARTWRIGAEFDLQPDLSVSLEATIPEPANGITADHTLAISATLRY